MFVAVTKDGEVIDVFSVSGSIDSLYCSVLSSWISDQNAANKMQMTKNACDLLCLTVESLGIVGVVFLGCHYFSQWSI